MGKFLLILAALKSVADLISHWFGRQADKVKARKDAAKDTVKKIFWLIVVVFVCGCTRAPPVTLSFAPEDYQDLKKGQAYTPSKDGFFMSEDVRKAYEAGVITEFYIRQKGFYVEEEK